MAYSILDELNFTPAKVESRASVLDELPDIPQAQLRLGENPRYEATRDSAAYALDMVPFAKYLMPTEREQFNQLSEEEKNSAIAWEAAGAALFLLGGPLLVGAGRAAKTALRPVGRGISKLVGRETTDVLASRLGKIAELPFEDKISGLENGTRSYKFNQFNLESRMRSSLAGEHFVQEEIDAITRARLTGDQRYLKDAVLERSFAGKQPSKAWSKYIETDPQPYGGFKTTADLDTLLSEDSLKNRFYTKQYKKILSKEVLGVNKYPKEFDNKTLERQMVARYGDDAKGKGFESLTENDAVDFLTDMLGNKRGYRTPFTSTTGGRWLPASLSPARFVLGSGEEFWQTKSKVYDKISKAWIDTQHDAFHDTLSWMKVLQERGLGTIKFNKYDEFKFKPHKDFTAAESSKAYNILREIDNTRLQKGVAQEEIEKQVNNLINQVDPNSVTRRIIDSWNDFSDTLYSKYIIHKIPFELRKAGNLTEFGHNSIDALTAKIIPSITKTFSTSAGMTGPEKTNFVRSTLNDIKKFLEFDPKTGVHPWFSDEGNALKSKLDNLTRQLTLSNDKGKFIGYTDHYVPRISVDQDNLMSKWSQALVGQKGFFTRARTSPGMVGEPVDFEQAISGRIMAQAKDVHMFPVIDEVVKHAQTLPTHYAEYIEHYISGILNRPSHMDHKIAGFLESSLGGIEKFLGGSGTWTANRLQNFANTVSNLTYLGALGFKPFSAARNLIQPLVTVPADLGGLKDYASLAKGYYRAFKDKGTFEYLKDIGVITDYAPELNLRPKALPFGKVFGKDVNTDKLDGIRDAAMWMFKASDRFNRIVTGAAAMSKWENAVNNFGEITANTVGSLMKKTGASGRNPWVKTEIEDLLRRGKIDDAKAVFVKDVTADTQFLYGPTEAPTVLRKFGVTSKTGFMFQSYPMNLAATMEKWFRSGSFPEAEAAAGMKRTINFMLSNAIAYSLMSQVWGSQSALRASFFGPFPSQVNEYMVPAAWTPVYRATRTIFGALEANPDLASEQAKKLLGSTLIFMPGGLQAAKTIKGSIDEGWTGFAKSIINVPKKTEGTIFGD